MAANELPMVMDNWVRSYASCERPAYVGRDIWYRGHRRTANNIVAAGATVTVAVYPANPGFPLGWVCYDHEARHVHYVFVRKTLRFDFGIGGSLLRHVESELGPGIVIATHVTPAGRAIVSRRKMWEYDPWALVAA